MTGQTQTPEPVHGTVNPASGEAAKERGTRRIAHLDPDWSARCDDAIVYMARLGIPFQSADLVKRGLVPEPPHPNCWGPRFIKASHDGIVEHHGYVKSDRATVHRSICHQWIGTAAYRSGGAA